MGRARAFQSRWSAAAWPSRKRYATAGLDGGRLGVAARDSAMQSDGSPEHRPQSTFWRLSGHGAPRRGPLRMRDRGGCRTRVGHLPTKEGFGVAGVADDLIRYIGGLTLFGGDCDGELFEVLPWERRMVRGTFRTGVKTSALSISRGKRQVATCGRARRCRRRSGRTPSPQPGRGSSRLRRVQPGQDSFRRRGVAATRSARFVVSQDRGGLRDSANEALLLHVPTGAYVRCVGNNPDLLHGRRAMLAILDEPAKFPKARA